MARTPIRTAGSEQDLDDWLPSDAVLGVGEDTAPAPMNEAQVRFEATMADPVIAAAVEQLVQKRVAELAAAPVAGAVPQGVDFLAAMQALGKQIADSINRQSAVTMEQMPGYVRPYTVEEIDTRTAAWTEMTAMLRDVETRYQAMYATGQMAEAERIVPIYLLMEDAFLPGEVGSELYVAGRTIRWFGRPGTYMEPKNEIATKLSDAAWRYIGGHAAPSDEDVASLASQINRPVMPGSTAPEMPPLLGPSRAQLGASYVESIAAQEVGPDRIMGTVVTEIRGGFGRGPRIVEVGA